MASSLRRNWVAYGVMLWLCALYVYFTFTAPVDPHTFELYPELTPVGLIWLRLSIAVPVVFIWFGLLYGAESVGRYAKSIGAGQEQRAWRFVAWGLSSFLMSIVFSSVVSIIKSRVVPVADGHVMALQVFRWVNLYSSLAFSLLAFSLLHVGSSRLLNHIGSEVSKRARLITAGVVVVIMLGLALLVFNNDYRTYSNDVDVIPVYGVSDGLIVLTVLIPYAVAWLLGGQTVAAFLTYRREVRGALYKDAFGKFALGAVLVLVLQIFSQLIGQFGELLSRLGLSSLLLLIYILIGLMVAGYLVIAWGAGRLIAIETAGLIHKNE